MAKPHIQTSEIVAAYKSGLTSYEVADKFGISQPTVIYRLRSAGVPRRNRWEQYASGTPEEAIALYQSGVGVPTIAKRLGVTNHAIYVRLQRAGIARRQHVYPVRNGAANTAWKGGRHLSRGYVMILVGPKQYRQEHRVVVEASIGRPLKDHEIVHHLNGVRTDNRIENLVITTRPQHESNTFVRCLQRRIRELEAIIQKKT